MKKLLPGVPWPAGSIAVRYALANPRPTDGVRISYQEGCDGASADIDLALRADPQGNDVTIRLIRGAALVGRVIDEFGDPVAEASVRAYHAEYSGGGRRLNPVRVAQTDDLGQFRLFGLAAGRYYVAANWRTDTPDAIRAQSQRRIGRQIPRQMCR